MMVINSIDIKKTKSSVAISATTNKRCLQLFVGGLASYLRYLCVLPYIGVQHTLYCVIVFISFVLCNLCWQFLWIFLLWLSLGFLKRLFPSNIIKYKKGDRCWWKSRLGTSTKMWRDKSVWMDYSSCVSS